MNKKSTISAVLSIFGLLLVFVGGVIWYAYETGYSYVVTHAEELAIINKAQMCLVVGLVLFIIGMAMIASRTSK